MKDKKKKIHHVELETFTNQRQPIIKYNKSKISLELQIINVYHIPRKFDGRKIALRHSQIKFLSSNVKK